MATVGADDDDPAAGYDPDRYYEQVVRGLRGRPHDLPPDLVVRYAIPDRPTELVLRAHLELVLKDWEARVEATREGEVYRALLSAHQEIEADPDVDLRSPDWWAHYRRPPDRPAAPAPARLRPAPPPAETSRPDRGAGSASTPFPVADDEPRGLAVRRCRAGAELAWVWPTWGTEAVVEWPTNAPDGMARERVHLTRHEYEQTGCWRTSVRDAETAFAVRVSGIGRAAPPLAATLPPRWPEVRYTVTRLWWRLGARDYRVVVSSQWPPPPYCELVVGWSRSRFLPDPEELHELASLPVSSGVDSRTVSLPRRSGARWLRCYLREGHEVDLVEPDVDRLRVRPWPR